MKREIVVALAMVLSQLWLIALMFAPSPLIGAWCVACSLVWVALAAVAAIKPIPSRDTP